MLPWVLSCIHIQRLVGYNGWACSSRKIVKPNRTCLLFRTICSWCRDVVLEGHSTDLGKPQGGWEIGMGRGRSVYKQPGPGWTRIAPRKEEGFQVSRRDSGKRGIVKGNQQGELTRGCAMA
jgi:hypothetical protein